MVCKNLTQQYGEHDLLSAKAIYQLLSTKVDDIEERVKNCQVDDGILLQTVLFLDWEMLADHALTFPTVYHKYVC